MIYTPQPGPQSSFFTCPVEEVFFGGGRGGGKTMGSLAFCGRHAETYPGAQMIFFRQRYRQLEEAVRLATQMFTGAIFKKTRHAYRFEWPNGSVLKLRELFSTDSVSEYQGHNYSIQVFEEVTNWPDSQGIDLMFGSLRSAEGHPCQRLFTGNPGGVGHHWVKARFIKPATPGKPFTGEDGIERVYIKSTVKDNALLMRNDPKYLSRLAATGSETMVRAWIDGDWDVEAGGFLEGIWDAARHVVEPFAVPRDWVRWRALDWGFSAPYAVGWFTMDFDGVIYLHDELYAWSGTPGKGTRETAFEVGKRIAEKEKSDVRGGVRFVRNPADRNIFTRIGSELSIAESFGRAGVQWVRASQHPGSRRTGMNEIVQRLRDGTFKVTSNCEHWLRTVPMLPADPDNPDDVDVSGEDHCWDMTQYSLMSRRNSPTRAEHKRQVQPFTMEWLESRNPETAGRSPYRL